MARDASAPASGVALGQLGDDLGVGLSLPLH